MSKLPPLMVTMGIEDPVWDGPFLEGLDPTLCRVIEEDEITVVDNDVDGGNTVIGEDELELPRDLEEVWLMLFSDKGSEAKGSIIWQRMIMNVNIKMKMYIEKNLLRRYLIIYFIYKKGHVNLKYIIICKCLE